MQINANYLLDNKGEKQFIMIPYLEREKIQKLLLKIEEMDGIKKGYKEVKKSKKSAKKLKSLSGFLI
jgi:hypothetical protein